MIEEKLDQRIAQWLQAHQQEVLERWMALIRIPSVRAEAAPGAPFGRECDRAMRLAADYFSGLGMSVRIEAEHGYAVAELGEGEKTLGLYCHADVVPAGDGWLYTQPFEPLLRDGYLIGRGAGDNKNGIMAAWCIAAMVQQLQLPLKSRLRVVIGSNEESGMADMTAYAQAERMPELNLAPDSGFACSLGEKGILRLWAQCDTPLEAVESLEGGDAFNIVLDRVEAVLKPNGALAEALAARGAEALRVDADGTVRFTATGIAKHAASPDGGENATAKAAALLAACPGLPESDRRILQQVEKWLQGFFGEGLGIAHEDSRFGRLTAVNGMVTTKNGHLCIALDCRYGTEQDPGELESRLRQCITGAGWQITWLQNRPGFAADPQSPVPETLRNIADSLSGLQTRCYYMSGGTYSRCLKNAFAVGTSLALADQKPTGLQIPAGRGGAHQRDEAVRVENFFRGIRALTHAVLACDRFV